MSNTHFRIGAELKRKKPKDKHPIEVGMAIVIQNSNVPDRWDQEFLCVRSGGIIPGVVTAVNDPWVRIDSVGGRMIEFYLDQPGLTYHLAEKIDDPRKETLGVWETSLFPAEGIEALKAAPELALDIPEAI